MEMGKKIVSLQADVLFRESGEETVRAALTLLGASDRAMVQVRPTGQIAALTAAAGEALLLSARDSIFERLSAVNAGLLRDALKRGEPLCFSDHLGGHRMYEVSVTPLPEGALLLLDPQQEQTLLSARVHQDVRAGTQNILLAAGNLSGGSSARYDALRKRVEEGASPDALLAEASRLQAEDAGRYRQVVREVLRIERALKHAEQLQGAPGPDAKPAFVEDDLAVLCRKCGDAFGERSTAQIEIRAPETLRAVYDPDWVACAVANLLTNAAGAEHVTVTLTRQDASLIIAVEDDGGGIPPEALFRLYHAWQEGFQPEAYLSEGTRAGLGLPLVRLIAEAHGGCLLHEQSERGGIFRLCLSDLLIPEPSEVRSTLTASGGFSVLDIEFSVL